MLGRQLVVVGSVHRCGVGCCIEDAFICLWLSAADDQNSVRFSNIAWDHPVCVIACLICWWHFLAGHACAQFVHTRPSMRSRKSGVAGLDGKLSGGDKTRVVSTGNICLLS